MRVVSCLVGFSLCFVVSLGISLGTEAFAQAPPVVTPARPVVPTVPFAGPAATPQGIKVGAVGSEELRNPVEATASPTRPVKSVYRDPPDHIGQGDPDLDQTWNATDLVPTPAQAPPRPVAATALPAPQPAPAPAPAAPPTYTETERLMVQLVQASDQLATCQQQLGVKNVVSLSLTVQQRIEQAHPGFTVNWQTGALVPKVSVK